MKTNPSNNPVSRSWRCRLGATVLASLLLAVSAKNASATLLAYEPFNYTAGNIAAGTVSTAAGTPTATTGGGFAGSWFGGGGNGTIVSGLTYAGLPTTGNAWVPDPGSYFGENFATAITPTANPTVYVSFLWKATAYSAGAVNGFALDNGAGASAGIFLGINSSGNFIVASGDAATTTRYTSPAPLVYGATYFIVVELNESTSATTFAGAGSVWINPVTGGSQPTPTGTYSQFSYSAATKIADLITINPGSTTVAIDEVRLGTTWADVTPLNASAAAVPTGVTATPGVNQVALTWADSGGTTTSYNIKRGTNSGGEAIIATVTEPTVSYTDTNTVGGATYYYEVSAVNSTGESANSTEVSANPTLGAPSAPASLSASPADSLVTLSWPAGFAAATYNVLRSTTSGAEVTLATGVATTGYSDTTAVNGTTYYYEVQSVNTAGTSGNSPEISATPQPYAGVYEPFNYTTLANGTAVTGTGETGTWTCGSTPSLVTGLTYTGLPTANKALSSSNGRQVVTFASPLTRGGPKWISFLYQASGNMGGNIDGVYFPNGGTGLFCGFGLAPNSGTQGGFGLGSTVTTGTGAVGAANLADSFLGTYGTTYLVVLEIQYNTGGGNDTVTLYLNPTANTASPSVAATYTVSSFNVGNITGIGLNVQGGATIVLDEIRTGSTFGSVVGYNPPGVPTGLTPTAGVNSVTLNWTAASGAATYTVLRSTVSGGETVLASGITATSYTDNTAVGGTTYYYTVEAVNGSGASAPTAEVSALPTIALPGVATALTAVGTNGAVILSWNLATGASGYNILRATSGGAEVYYDTTGATNYTDAGVANGTTYYYEIVATNTAGNSGVSGEASATPNSPPVAPAGLAATPGNNQVVLTWTASPSAVSYNIYRSTSSGAEVVIASTTTPGYTDATAIKFTPYFYEVSAVSADGESLLSSEVTATPTGTYGPTAYESFNYPVGTFANNTPSTAMGFTGNWTIPTGAQITTNLTYAGLPTSGNAYLQTASGFQNTESLATPIGSGTAFISFLIAGSGNPGGNSEGIFLPGNNGTSLFCGFEGGYSPTETSFGLGSVSTTTLQGATVLGNTTPISNTGVHLAVIEIDFNTSGANDTVSLWIDPPAGVASAGTPANIVVSNYDVGTISGFGMNMLGAFGYSIDEVRFGQVYGDVVGYGSAPVVNASPTNIVSSVTGNQLTLSWPADHTGWTLQAQTNSLSTGLTGTWYPVTGSTTTNQMILTIDPAQPAVFYELIYNP